MMTTDRDIALGFVLLALLSAGLTERARVSLRATALNLAPGARVETAASQSGWFGSLSGKASRAHMRIADAAVLSAAIPDKTGRWSLPVRVRRTELEARNVSLMNVGVRRLRAVQGDVTVPGSDILSGRAVGMISGGPGYADILVDTASLEDQISSKMRQLRNVSIASGGGMLCVNADSTLPPGRLTALARLDVRDATDVIVTKPEVWLNGTVFEGPLVHGMLQALNPVFTLNASEDLRSRYEIRDVAAGEGVLRVGLAIRPRNARKAVAR